MTVEQRDAVKALRRSTADFLRHTLLEIDAEAAAFEAAYPGSRGAPGDLDGAFAQLAYARIHAAKALAALAAV